VTSAPSVDLTTGITLDQLRYFAAIIDEGSFHGAAEALGLAQPSLSRAIAQLETRLNSVLLYRTPRGVRLTAVGEEIIPQVRAILRTVHAITAGCDAHNNLERGRVSFGAIAIVTQIWLPTVLATLSASHPGVQVSVHEGGSRRNLSRILQGHDDFGIVSHFGGTNPHATNGSITLEEIARDTLVACIPARHPLARRTRLTAADLRSEPMIAYNEDFIVSDAMVDAFGPGFQVALRTDNTETAKRMVAAGVGVAFVGELGRQLDPFEARGDLVYRRVDGMLTDIHICVATPGGFLPSPAARRCLDLIREAAMSATPLPTHRRDVREQARSERASPRTTASGRPPRAGLVAVSRERQPDMTTNARTQH